MNKVQRKKRLTLQDLFNSDAPIWVKNMTGRKDSRWEKTGNVILQVGDSASIDPLYVTPGNDPICLSDMTDYESLKKCRDLFKSIRVGTLQLMNPEDAEKYYEKHQDRLTAVEEKLKRYTSKEKEEVTPKEATSSNIALSMRVTDVCLKLKHKAIGERKALENLIEASGAFTMDDYGYLLSNGKFKSIKNWAKDQMAALSEDSEDEENVDNE